VYGEPLSESHSIGVGNRSTAPNRWRREFG
jgi:hypothetical protein